MVEWKAQPIRSDSLAIRSETVEHGDFFPVSAERLRGMWLSVVPQNRLAPTGWPTAPRIDLQLEGL